MGLRFNTNVASLHIRNNLFNQSSALSRSFGRLSSGLRINTAADDPAGLAMANGHRARAMEKRAALRNVDDGISFAATAAEAAAHVTSLLDRMKEISLQAASETLSDGDRQVLDAQYQEAAEEIERIANDTEFNGIKIMQGGSIQVVVGGAATDRIQIFMPDAIGGQVAFPGTFTLDSAATAKNIQGFIDAASDLMGIYEGLLGAVGSRMQYTREALMSEQVQALQAESNVRDVDYALETAEAARLQILQQGSIAMLAQANAQPEQALALLQSSLRF